MNAATRTNSAGVPDEGTLHSEPASPSTGLRASDVQIYDMNDVSVSVTHPGPVSEKANDEFEGSNHAAKTWNSPSAKSASFQSLPSPPGFRNPSRVFIREVKEYAVIQRVKAFWIAVYLASVGAAFGCIFQHYEANSLFACVGYPLPVAKGSAYAIMVTSTFLLLCMCRRFLGYLRRFWISRFLPLDNHRHFHILCALMMVPFTIMHVTCHYIIGARLSVATGPCLEAAIVGGFPITKFNYYLLSYPGLTGQIMFASFLFLYATSPAIIRRKKFGLFYNTHLIASTLYWICLLVHGSDALLEWPKAPLFIGPPLLLYLWQKFELISWGYCKRWPILDASVGSSNILTVKIECPDFTFRPGQYIFLDCGRISGIQWHPFSVASAPGDGELMLRIGLVGGWTKEFADYATTAVSEYREGKRDHLPTVHLDGPYGAPAQHALEHEYSILIATGIGVTPFLSNLQRYRDLVGAGLADTVAVKHIYFFWVNRSPDLFDELADVWESLKTDEMKERLTVALITTNAKGETPSADQLGKFLRGMKEHRIATFNGRPDWERELGSLTKVHLNKDIHLFFCGNPGLANTLQLTTWKINVWRKPQQARLHFHKEIF